MEGQDLKFGLQLMLGGHLSLWFQLMTSVLFSNSNIQYIYDLTFWVAFVHFCLIHSKTNAPHITHQCIHFTQGNRLQISANDFLSLGEVLLLLQILLLSMTPCSVRTLTVQKHIGCLSFLNFL